MLQASATNEYISLYVVSIYISNYTRLIGLYAMTDKSQDMLNESISSLVDGENSELELARILKASAGSSPLSGEAKDKTNDSETSSSVYEKWQRYHLAGEILRGDAKSASANLSVPASFTSNVLAAIEAEETITHTSPSHSPVQGFSHKLGKIAIAASVSLAVLIGFQYVGNDPTSAGSPAVVSNKAKTTVNPAELPGARVPEGFELPSITARTVSNIDVNYGNSALQSSLTPSELPAYISPTTSFAPGSEEEKAMRAQLKLMMLKHAEANSSPYSSASMSESVTGESAGSTGTVDR